MSLNLVLFLTLYVCASAQAQFEGTIESKNLTTDETGSPQQFTMTMYVKNGMVKIHNSAIGTSPSSTMIYRNDKKVVWMLNEEERTYFEIRQDDKAEQLQVPVETKKKRSIVQHTGKT
ncbi:MAG: hypothetical protein AAB393_06760, partial [Bacteroidota bacterium]